MSFEVHEQHLFNLHFRKEEYFWKRVEIIAWNYSLDYNNRKYNTIYSLQGKGDIKH